MNTYYDAKEMLKKELDNIVSAGELTAGSLETIDKLLHAIKNACKVIMYEEYADQGYSYADSDADMTDYSYARGRGRNAKRDSMGRYSTGGHYARRGGYSYADKDEKIEMLRGMMNEVSTEDERRALQKIIRKMEMS